MQTGQAVGPSRDQPSFDVTPSAGPLVGLEPRLVWDRFAALLEMPRPSGKEGVVRDALIKFANRRGLESKVDEVGNVTIRVPGRGAGINTPVLAIQAHMDMVGTCADGVTHDFERDPIRARRATREIRGALVPVIEAEGTTLGADNGIGLCMTLALVDDHSLVDAPPLELVFTVDEERGLRGAKQISPQLLTASRLLNLDTETEGEIYISCAGSMDVAATIPAPREPAPANSAWVRLEIGELPGGHSGIDIHNDRVNPLTVFPHFVQRFIDSGMELRIASIAGGDKRNAIPKRLEVLLVIPAAEESTLLERVDEVWKECARSVFPGAANPGRVSVASRLGDEVIAPMTKDTEGNILAALSALPHGVIAWSQAVAGLVETSNNVARITTNGNVVGIECMARSSAPAALQGVVLQLDAIFRAHGFKVETANESPGWEAESESELLARTSAAYRDTLGITPEIRAVHAGLECGAFKRVNPALQMVSFGPDIGGAHTPEEYVSIPSVSNIYRVLQEVVRRHASLNA